MAHMPKTSLRTYQIIPSPPHSLQSVDNRRKIRGRNGSVDKIVNQQTGKTQKIGQTEVLQQADLKPETYDLLYKALKHTVDDGTARRVKIKGLDVYAKTGTAQNPHGADHGWFMAFAGKEGEAPSIALAVFVEFGEGGSSAAGPIARTMLETYFGLNTPVPAEAN